MKKRTIISLLLLSFLLLAAASEVHAAVTNEGPNIFYVSGNTTTSQKIGWRISPRVSGSIANVTLYGTNAVKVYLYNDAQTILYSSGTCTTTVGTNNVCTFSNSSNTVTNLQSYYLLFDNSSSSYLYNYQTTGLAFPYTFSSYYINGTQNNGGTHPVTNEIANILNVTINTTPIGPVNSPISWSFNFTNATSVNHNGTPTLLFMWFNVTNTSTCGVSSFTSNNTNFPINTIGQINLAGPNISKTGNYSLAVSAASNCSDNITQYLLVNITNTFPVNSWVTQTFNHNSSSTNATMCTDPDNDALVFSGNVSSSILTQYSNGTIYAPGGIGTVGSWFNQIGCSDTLLNTSKVVQWSITNTAPVNAWSTQTFNHNTSQSFATMCSDPDNDPLTYSGNVSSSIMTHYTNGSIYISSGFSKIGNWYDQIGCSDTLINTSKVNLFSINNTAPINNWIAHNQTFTNASSFVIGSYAYDPDGDSMVCSENLTMLSIDTNATITYTASSTIGIFSPQIACSDTLLNTSIVGSWNISSAKVLTIKMVDVVTNQSIRSFCFNATGTNTTQAFCVDNGLATFVTTGTYNISTFNVGALVNTTAPTKLITATNYKLSSSFGAGGQATANQWCSEQYGANATSYNTIYSAASFVDIAYWDGAAWQTIDGIDAVNYIKDLTCVGGNITETYFNQSIQNFAFTQSATLTFNTSQGYINIQPYRLFLNNNVNGFNLTNNRTSGSTSGSSLILNASFGDNNYAVSVAGNYTVNMTCSLSSLFGTALCVGPAVYDDLFKINATDADSGSPVTTFTVTATNVSIGAVSSNSTTNGTAYLPLIRGYYYNFLINPSGHAITNVTLPANSSKNNYTFILLAGNSIYLFFFDESTLAPILSNISVVFANSSTSFENTSTTGTMIQGDLVPGIWTLNIGSANGSSDYTTRQYFLDITNQSSQDLNAYLSSAADTEASVFTIKDGSTTALITGASVTLQMQISGNWVTIDEQVSDIFGVVQFELIPSKQYRITVDADGYQTKQGDFYATQTTYTIVLNNLNVESFETYQDDFSYTYAPNNVSRALTNFSITASSPNGSIDWFAVKVTVNGTTSIQNMTASPAGGTAQVSLDLTPYTNTQVLVWYYVKSVNFDQPLVISNNFYLSSYVAGNYTLDDFMTHYKDDDNGLSTVSRGILLTIGAVILAALLGMIFGGAAAVIGASGVFIVGAWYGWIHPSIIFIVVGGLLGGILLLGRGR